MLLRFAPHIGYLPHDPTPLFVASAGTDPVQQILFAASNGMAGIMDPWASVRPQAQVTAMSSALRDNDLSGGCVCAVALPHFTQPLWVAESALPELREDLGMAMRRAVDLDSKVLAVLLFAEPDTANALQRRRASDRLRDAADAALAKGITLAIEPLGNVPGQLLGNFTEAADFVREVDHPGVRLIFDTGHVAASGEPTLESFVEAYDQIALLQLADMPGRVEIGAGNIDFVPILSHAVAQGYEGLVELEYSWSRPGFESERRGLEALIRLDKQVRDHVAANRSTSCNAATENHA
jgi:hydroxypyruvate isomerase